MKICIYCQKIDQDTIFSGKKGEHVIPQFLGKFDLFFGDDLVCAGCNNRLSKLETLFKEGSLAGVHSAVYGIDNTKSRIRVRKDRVSWTISTDTGELGVFKEAFPFVRLTDLNARPKSIVILDHKDSKIKHILFIEKYALYAKKQDTKSFKNRKDELKKLKQRFKTLDISLFGDTKKGWTIENIVALLKDYGLDYNKKSEEKFEDKKRGKKWIIDYTENGDAETLKTPVKIAFNYFAFCAKKANMAGILQNQTFDYVRKYLLFGELPPSHYRPSFSYNSNSDDKRGLHIITFQKDDDFITSIVSLFGRFNYKVILGHYPFSVQSNNFGCATAFDPFSGKIINEIYSTPQPQVGKQNYGLFCR